MVNKNLKTIIDNSLKQNKLSHCYLLNAEAKVNIDDSILYIINKTNNTELKTLKAEELPPTVLFFENDLAKEKIVEVLESSTLSAFNLNETKFIILKNIEFARKETLNALLKSIEEPSDNTCFILTTSNKNKVLGTIKSRSIVINITAPSNNDLEELLIHDYELDKKTAWFYSNIFVDENEFEKYREDIDYELVLNLASALQQSLNNRYLLYLYLVKFTKKDSKNKMIFLIKALRFLLYLSIVDIPIPEAKISKVVEKVKGSKIDIKDCFISISDYLSSIDTYQNYFLQTEKMLVRIMECYE